MVLVVYGVDVGMLAGDVMDGLVQHGLVGRIDGMDVGTLDDDGEPLGYRVWSKQ